MQHSDSAMTQKGFENKQLPSISLITCYTDDLFVKRLLLVLQLSGTNLRFFSFCVNARACLQLPPVFVIS